MKLISLFPTNVKPVSATNAFDNLFNDFFRDDFPVSFRNGSVLNSPAINIVESEDDYRIEVAAPGYDKVDFDLKVENDLLTISAKKEVKEEEKKEKYTRREFSHVEFSRNFHLPETVNAAGITANYENGILFITLAKKEEAKPLPPKTIEVS